MMRRRVDSIAEAQAERRDTDQAEADRDAMLVDLEYRLILLELGVDDHAVQDAETAH